jgi:hypothetical protein
MPPSDHEAAALEAVARLTDEAFCAAVGELSIADLDVLTAALFANKHTDEERGPLLSKYRLLADHRTAALRREHPDWFFD